MIKTITFTDENTMHRFTVMTDFLRYCSNPEGESAYNLMNMYKMKKFLHNEDGPAIIRLFNLTAPRKDREEYWIKGKKIPYEEGEKMLSDIKFNNKLESMVNDTD